MFYVAAGLVFYLMCGIGFVGSYELFDRHDLHGTPLLWKERFQIVFLWLPALLHLYRPGDQEDL